LVGVEFWNSYSSNYLVALGDTFQLTVSNVIRTCLTNEVRPYSPTNPPPWSTLTTFFTNISYAVDPEWFFQPRPRFSGGFAVPLSNAAPVLTNMIYRPIAGTFEPVRPTNSFTANNGLFVTPQWGLSISSELTCMLSVNGRILDFVHLPHFDSYLNITEQLMSEGDGPTDTGFNLGTLWRTNRLGNSTSLSAPTEGVLQQLVLSLVPSLLSDEDWKNYNNDCDPVTGSDRFKAATVFASFLSTNSTNINLAMQTPFNPIRKYVQTVSLQANDPLVHSRLDDLVDQTDSPLIEFLRYPQPPFTNSSLGKLNERSRPWGGNPMSEPEMDPTAVDLGLKDPGVWRSDDWHFPTNLLPDLALIGRVHRGTPWQTIYLKSAVADPSMWATQSPDPRTHPTNDWRLVSALVSLWSTNDPRALGSINETSAVAWGNVLHGITVLSNLPLADLLSPPEFEVLTMASNSPQAALIAEGINRTRSGCLPQYFPELGDLFATPELSTASPWLDRSGDISLIFELNDEAYEAMPAQLLSRVRADPVGQITAQGDQLRIRFRSFPGNPYAVEVSGNLRDWQAVHTGFSADGTVEFLDSASPGPGQKFYRLQLP